MKNLNNMRKIWQPCTRCNAAGTTDTRELIRNTQGKYVTRTVRRTCPECRGTRGKHILK